MRQLIIQSKIIRLALIISITSLQLSCLPEYVAGRALVRVLPIEQSDDNKIAYNAGATFEKSPASNENENGIAGQVFLQANRTFKYGSLGLVGVGYIGSHSINSNNGDSSEFYTSMDGNRLKYYGLSPELRLTTFVPFGRNRLGIYGTANAYHEAGSYAEFRSEGKKLDAIVMDGGNNDIQIGAGLFYERQFNPETKALLQVGFNTLWLTGIAKIKYRGNGIWISVLPTESGIADGLFGVGFSRDLFKN